MTIRHPRERMQEHGAAPSDFLPSEIAYAGYHSHEHRQDYARAGMHMLPPADVDGVVTFRRILLCSVALLPVSLLPSYLGATGPLYPAGALLLGAAFVASGWWAARYKTGFHARVILHKRDLSVELLAGALEIIDRPRPQ